MDYPVAMVANVAREFVVCHHRITKAECVYGRNRAIQSLVSQRGTSG